MESIKIDPRSWPVENVLDILLLDRTAKRNIIFATDSYVEKGELYTASSQIAEQLLVVDGECIIQPRVLKNVEEQQSRTRKRAEVFTPSWVCCMMNNHADEVWFGRPDVFGHLDRQTWNASPEKVEMPKQKRWQAYVDSKRLEITCGEAPYLVSRYDMATGEIIPIENRIGILDRKLRIVNENAENEKEWRKWALRAFQASYGYEYQGDSLLIARINLLNTYVDYMQKQLGKTPEIKELREAAKIISWNIWQMDGLKGTIPTGALEEQYHQLDLKETFEGIEGFISSDDTGSSTPCRIFDWRGGNRSVLFNSLKDSQKQ